MTDRYRVVSSHAEDIASGRLFEPGEWATGVDPDHPYDRAKIAAGRLVPEREMQGPSATDAAEAKAVALGVDLSTVTGSGAGGQIKASDVESAAKVKPNEEESQ